VTQFLEERGILSILNVPYCPQYNAIEKTWAEAKRWIRTELTKRKLQR
jgi:transposase